MCDLRQPLLHRLSLYRMHRNNYETNDNDAMTRVANITSCTEHSSVATSSIYCRRVDLCEFDNKMIIFTLTHSKHRYGQVQWQNWGRESHAQKVRRNPQKKSRQKHTCTLCACVIWAEFTSYRYLAHPEYTVSTVKPVCYFCMKWKVLP